ncbi:MAG: chloride channel protein [Lachnospiraceae bacterium]|jgi:H+/Cl- antiporter ClcA|nr:chloride channel protein [Lachnospiraceae bacterium]MEE3461240.1 chloride channel protein [Lachnospiraceae bacterium]
MRELKLIKFYALRIINNFLRFLRWAIFSIFTGLVIGAVGTAFVLCFNAATSFRNEHEWLIYLLPFGGLLIVFLYRSLHYSKDRGTNLVLSSIHSEEPIPFRMAPLIFISTLITHFFGGSSGREGAALQIGGSIGSALGTLFKFDEKDQRIVVLSGMSAAFSVVFGTPLAAVIFSMEVASVGVMYYAALVPCAFASITAFELGKFFGVRPSAMILKDIPGFSAVPVIQIIILAILCAYLSAVFCMILHGTGDLLKKRFHNQYLRVAVSSVIIILLTLILKTDIYMGAGLDVIRGAVEGKSDTFAFLFKMILTALTLGGGLKGGEIVPSFFVGATFGSVMGNIIGLSPSLCAGVGMVSVFCGVTNCPVTSLFIAFELFGYKGVGYFLIAISISYLLSGYYGLYHDQTIVYSKYKAEYINKHTKDK